jgi:hypothetical protein
VKSYQQFLESKIKLADRLGFDVDESEINAILKPHQKAMVRWAVAGGRRAIFAAFGLGKTVVQLEILRLILVRTGGRGLIVLPLGVRAEFIRDAAMLGFAVKFIRRIEDADAGGIYLTNYETVRDGKLDPKHFVVASLDEAAILRSFGGTKTFREFMAIFSGDARRAGSVNEVKYRFVATATPSPNEYIEMLSYAAFLGIMDVGHGKTRFFQRNSEQNDDLTLYPHKVDEFWLWVASWALFVQSPADLGFDATGYDLPPMTVRWHEVPSDHSTAGADRAGQGRLFRESATSLSDAAKERRDSLPQKLDKLGGLIDAYRKAEGVRQELLPEESAKDTCSSEDPISREPRSAHRQGETIHSETWREGEGVQETASPAPSIRHGAGGLPGHVGRPGWRLRNLHEEHPHQKDDGGPLPSDETGAGNSLLSMQCSDRPIRGQSRSDEGGGGLPDQMVIWCDLNKEQSSIERVLANVGLSFVSIYGSEDIEDREMAMDEWKAKRRTVFVSKPIMYGSGVNMQQCHKMIFLGIGYKFAQFYQAIHRVYRFLQQHPVEIDIIYSEAEREIRSRLEEKWARHNEQVAIMSDLIRQYGLGSNALADGLIRTIGCVREEIGGETWRAIHNDCVAECRDMPENSADLIITSIPFEGQYEYSPSYNDFGHSENSAQFWAQMDFLIPNLLRVLRPGRVCAIHVKDRITPGGINGFGFQTVTPVSDYCTQNFVKHGFAFLARKTIVTDVVRENNQTYRLGWTEQCKDGSRMGAGMPEYLMVFRKPPTDRSNGYADAPVVKTKPLSHDRYGNVVPYEQGEAMIPDTGYSRSRWQIDAAGFSRSSGNRFLVPQDLIGVEAADVWKIWKQHSLSTVYDFEHHVACCEGREAKKQLPKTFFLLPPHSWHPEVWTDITRMRTLNGAQHAAGRELHICPMQFDIIDRAIVQYSMAGETVLDPFGGLMTVPYCAIKLGRKGIGIELNGDYFRDGVSYCRAAEAQAAVPTLFDLMMPAAAE